MYRFGCRRGNPPGQRQTGGSLRQDLSGPPLSFARRGAQTAPMPELHPRARHAQTSIFTHMSLLAARHGAVNLGQGFPSNPPPAFLLD